VLADKSTMNSARGTINPGTSPLRLSVTASTTNTSRKVPSACVGVSHLHEQGDDYMHAPHYKSRVLCFYFLVLQDKERVATYVPLDM
jgi:hypothetical protein